jgi:heptaprenyl diphosphate synthase
MSSPLETLGLPTLPADLERVEQGLRDAVRHADPFLGEVAGHLVGAGGKRLRPALTVCAAYAARGAGSASAEAIAGGCSVELVHLGSLYHDDVIDEAETRRGVESVNSRWSNIVAILAGDFLLARASEIAASLGADVAALLAATIGELCRGQVLELQNLFNRPRPTCPRSPGRPRRCSPPRAASAGWCRTWMSPRSTRSPRSATTSACASRSWTTCST